MSISKYRLTENDVQEMVMSTAKRILENRQLLKGVVNEMKEGQSAINEDTFYGTPRNSSIPSIFGGNGNAGGAPAPILGGTRPPVIPPYGYRPPFGGGMPPFGRPPMMPPFGRPPMMPPFGRPPFGMPPMGPPPEYEDDARDRMRRALIANIFAQQYRQRLEDYYRETHGDPSYNSGNVSGGGYGGHRGGYGGGSRSGGGYGGGNNSGGGSRSRRGSSTPNSGGTPSSDSKSGSTSGNTSGSTSGTPSGNTANTPTIKEVPPTIQKPEDRIMNPTRREPVAPEAPVVGGGGSGSSNRSNSGGDIGVRGNNNNINYKQDSHNVDNSRRDDHSYNVDNSSNSHNTTTNTTNNINQSQHYDQRSSTNNIHVGGDRNIGNRRGGGGGRPPISRPVDHDHGPRRDFGGNGGGMRHNDHGGFRPGRGGRRPGGGHDF